MGNTQMNVEGRELDPSEAFFSSEHPSAEAVIVATAVLTLKGVQEALDEQVLAKAAKRVCVRHPFTRARVCRATQRMLFTPPENADCRVTVGAVIDDLSSALRDVEHSPDFNVTREPGSLWCVWKCAIRPAYEHDFPQGAHGPA
jgi:hypothetical protein